MSPPSVGRAFTAAVLRGEPVQWSSLDLTPAAWLNACVREGVASLVHRQLAADDAGNEPPPAIRHLFEEHARAELTRELVRMRETAAVLAALDSAGIPAVLIKGTALAYTCYDEPWMRPRSDTDLVIPRQHVERARTALQPLGYVAANACDGEWIFGQFECARTDAFGIDHAFDIHWKISTQAVFASVLSCDELASESAAVPALAPPGGVTRPPRAAHAVHALLLACIHPAMHHHNDDRLIWLYDVHLLAKTLGEADSREFVRLAGSRGVAAVCAFQLARAQREFGTTMSEQLMETLRRAPAAERSAAYLRAGRRWRHDMIASLRALPGWRQRAQLTREVLLPARRYMLATYGVAASRRSAALLPALYMHRLVRGTWKVVTGQKR